MDELIVADMEDWWAHPMWCGRCVIYGLYNDWPSYSYWIVLHEDCW